jgi:hypothetical protein
MFQSKTLFVIGAGASEEVGMPISYDLGRNLGEALNLNFGHYSASRAADPELKQALREYSRNSAIPLSEIANACKVISQAMEDTDSIDAFIDNHRGNEIIEKCAKIGIANSILKKERTSALFVDPNNTFNVLDRTKAASTWYSRFWNKLAENMHRDNLQSIFNSISVISFNYDRCLEQYLYYSLRSRFDISHEAAIELLDGLELYHPYGSLGKLDFPTAGPQNTFGENPTHTILTRATDGILTYSETVKDKQKLSAMRKQVETSKVIVFLGCAFHQPNIDLIKPEKTSDVAAIYATAFKIPEPEIAVVMGRILIMLDNSIQPHHVKISHRLKCHALIREYRALL